MYTSSAAPAGKVLLKHHVPPYSCAFSISELFERTNPSLQPDKNRRPQYGVRYGRAYIVVDI